MSSSLTKGLRRSTSRSKAKPAAAKTAKRAVKSEVSHPKAKRASAAKPPLPSPLAKKAVKTAAAKKTAAKSEASCQSQEGCAEACGSQSCGCQESGSSRGSKRLRSSRPFAQSDPRQLRHRRHDHRRRMSRRHLVAFERAHKEFVRGRFAEARNQFRVLVDKYSQVSEVAARARTYLAIAESRLRTESMLPRDADSLYDRGVIELNRGEYVAAQEMFERALKREPEAAHIHYGLAATRARLGSIDLALESLQTSTRSATKPARACTARSRSEPTAQ